MKALFISNSSSGMYSFRREVVEAIGKQAETYLCAPHNLQNLQNTQSSQSSQSLQNMNNMSSTTDIVDTTLWNKIGCKFINYEFDRHGKNPLRELKHISFYRKLLREIKPDIVFTYTIKPNVYAGMACANLSIPYVANITGLGDAIENGGFMQKISLMLYKYGLRKAACVFFQNSMNRQFFLDNKLLLKSIKHKVIPGSGVNLDFHNFETYPEDENEIRFLFVARIKKDKGINELLEAINIIRKSHPECVVEILGKCEDDYSLQLKDAEKRGDVRVFGEQIDVHSYYKRCHCVILPSYHEGTSNVLLEGSATGRPVIATRVPGCQEIFDEGITGLGCEAKSVDSLVRAMKKFISKSKQEREIMGIAARKKVEREFDRNIVLCAYLDEMNAIVGKRELK